MPRKPPTTRKAGPVGRDDVLAELRRVVDEAVAGHGHLLLLALMLGQARPHRAGPAAGPQLTLGSSARSAENASAT